MARGKNCHGLPAKGWLQSLIALPELGCTATILIWPSEQIPSKPRNLVRPTCQRLVSLCASETPPPHMGEASGMNWTDVIQT